jgi:hypothetical protein
MRQRSPDFGRRSLHFNRSSNAGLRRFPRLVTFNQQLRTVFEQTSNPERLVITSVSARRVNPEMMAALLKFS